MTSTPNTSPERVPEMVERVAKQIAQAWDEAGRRLYRGWENLDAFERERALAAARAAIAAMRDITQAMITAGERRMVAHGLHTSRSNAGTADIWQAQIDEALR